MKKYISLLLALAIVLLSGCSAAGRSEKRSVVATIFPVYDWVIELLGDQAADTDVTMLLDSGVDLHSYQPTADDIIRISACDLFIYVGGESDKWVDDVLREAVNKDMVVINLMDVLGESVREEELVEGMQGEEDEEAADEPEYDEHVWLSVRNAGVLCTAIGDALARIDAPHADAYAENTRAYCDKLSALDARYAAAVADAKTKTVLFGDRFPFRYLVDDYGLSYYAAFVGCSAESEASFETITFLSGKMDELGLSTILTLDGSDGRIAQTIRENTREKNAAILTMNSMQSTTAKDVVDGATYLSIMEQNLTALQAALS